MARRGLSPREMASYLKHPPGKISFEWHAYILTYLQKAMTGIGYLALTWSTVVLLGGFVASLQRKDFWCLTVISMMQAARIFNYLEEKLAVKILQELKRLFLVAVSTFRIMFACPGFWYLANQIMFVVPCLLLIATCYSVVFFCGYRGPIACIALALWRIVQRDYGINDGDVTKANLAPALDLFYVLILCQGALYVIWRICHLFVGNMVVGEIRSYKILRDIWLVDYLLDTKAKCLRDTASIKGRTLRQYAVDLIHSESWGDQLSGMRMLATFIEQGEDVRHLLLSSRPMVQKLIDTLGWRVSAGREIREAAACIVAHLAYDIQLAQFPGAIRCISTLLEDESTRRYWLKEGRQSYSNVQSRYQSDAMHKMVRTLLVLDQGAHNELVDDDGQCTDKEGGGCNELILQGLAILERLASDHHNCMDISNTPGIVPKIMAPLCSNAFIQGVKNNAWAEVVNGTFKVLYMLIRCPGLTGESLRREIAASQQAISNLQSILEQSNEAGQELQMLAMVILTELALDSSANLTMETKENLVKKELKIFLDEDSADISKVLKATAGRALVSLTTNCEENSSIVNDSVGSLTEIFDAKHNFTYRTIAAQILENICVHCDLDKECVKDTLLPQVLGELLCNKREPFQRAEENQRNDAPVDDEENQNNAPTNDEENENNAPGLGDENQDVSAKVDNTEIQEISSTTDENKLSDQGNAVQTATRELQESFLSLTLVIYKLISTDDFDEAVQKKGIGNGEFVVKLKTILEENCKETVYSLSVVKLCGQIAATMMSRNQYTEHFRNQGFAESLSKAKKIMSNLESCILFAWTYPKMMGSRLLSELEEQVQKLVN